MHYGAQRVLEQCRPGVLFNDLSACNAYQGALAAAAQIKVPATLIVGERDMMTPANRGMKRMSERRWVKMKSIKISLSQLEKIQD